MSIAGFASKLFLDAVPEAVQIVDPSLGFASKVAIAGLGTVLDRRHAPDELANLALVETTAAEGIDLAEYSQFPDSASLSAARQREHAIRDLGRVANLMDQPLSWIRRQDRDAVRKIAVVSAMPLLRILIEAGAFADVWSLGHRTRTAAERLSAGDLSTPATLLNGTRLLNNRSVIGLSIEATGTIAYAAKKLRLDKRLALSYIAKQWSMAQRCPPLERSRLIMEIGQEAAILCTELPPRRIDQGLAWTGLVKRQFNHYDGFDREVLLAMTHETEARVYRFGDDYRLGRKCIDDAIRVLGDIGHGSADAGSLQRVRVYETMGRLELADRAWNMGYLHLATARGLADASGITPKVATIQRDLDLWA